MPFKFKKFSSILVEDLIFWISKFAKSLRFSESCKDFLYRIFSVVSLKILIFLNIVSNDNFEIYISKLYGLYGTTTGYEPPSGGSDTYTFYYNGKYELVNQSDAIIIMELTFPTYGNGKTTQPKVTVSRYNSKTNKPEKTLFSN